MTPVGCTVGPPITGQLNLEGIPVLGLVNTGASVTCLGFSVWWRYSAQWGPLKPFEGTVHGAHGKPLQIAGKTQHLDLQWGEARGRACFIVIVGLESPPCLIGMDIMRPLCVRIDVTNGTATPAQPDPQTVHLKRGTTAAEGDIADKCRSPAVTRPAMRNLSACRSPAARQPLPSPPREIAPPAATLHTASSARLLQTAEIPAKTARLVHCHNPWPTEDVYFCTGDALPAFVTGIPALSSGPELWVAIHNHRLEPLRLHSGQNIGVLEVVTVANRPSSTSKPGPDHQPPVPEHLSPLQQQQLNDLFKEFSDVFSQGGRRPRLHSAAGAHHRDARASALPTLLASIPGCSTGGDGAGPADAGQRRHPPLQQSLGFAGGDGEEKRTVACGFASTFDSSTRLPSRMRTLYPGLTTSSTHFTGLASSQLSI